MGIMTGFFGHLVWLEAVRGRTCKEVFLDEMISKSSIVWNGLHFLVFVDLSETEDSGLCLEKCAYT